MKVGGSFGHFDQSGVAGYSSGAGNHCMHADGCKKLPDGRWALDNVNSWGPGWGPWHNGRCFLIDKHINNAQNGDAYLIKGASEDPKEPIKPPLAKAEITETITGTIFSPNPKDKTAFFIVETSTV